MQKITDNVYVENGFRGCNTSFVVTSEGVVVIDTPMVPQEARKWRDEIAKFGPVRYVINSEPHSDHISGNAYFEGLVIGHEGTREAILHASVDELTNGLKMMAPDSLPLEAGFKFRPSDITFSQRMTLFLGKHTFQLINLPGHSPYQTAVYVPEERVVFTSDNVIQGMPFFHQALPYEWLESLKKYQQLEVDKLVPGHGGVCDKSYLLEMSKIVQDWIEVVKEAIAGGMSQEEAQEKVMLLKRYPDMAKDQRLQRLKRMNVGRLYQVLKMK
jgi:cyclase